MATIYHGWDTLTQRVVAIKVLREDYSQDPKFVRRFQKEAEAMYSLHHPNIVQVYDYGQYGSHYFLVMELIEGTDLRRYLRSRGILDVKNAVLIAYNVALGLGAAHHQGIIYRNVKPTSILLGRDGSIKMTGFSLASISAGMVLYYAPEQVQGEIVTPAADVYCLGNVLYQMVTDHPPFDGDSPVVVAMQHIHDVPKPPSQFNLTISPALEEIILHCLEKAPEKRFRDGSELARALEALM